MDSQGRPAECPGLPRTRLPDPAVPALAHDVTFRPQGEAANAEPLWIVERLLVTITGDYLGGVLYFFLKILFIHERDRGRSRLLRGEPDADPGITP